MPIVPQIGLVAGVIGSDRRNAMLLRQRHGGMAQEIGHPDSWIMLGAKSSNCRFT